MNKLGLLAALLLILISVQYVNASFGYSYVAGEDDSGSFSFTNANASAFYICAGDSGNGGITYTSAGNIITEDSSSYSFVAQQPSSGTCSFSATPELVGGSIGVNAPATTYTLYTANGFNNPTGSYTVTSSQQTTLITGLAGWDGGSFTFPSGCSTFYTHFTTYTGTEFALCTGQSPNTYQVTSSSPGDSGISIAMYVFNPPGAASMSISNSIVDVGQYETINGMFTGTSPYTYNFIISNTVTPSVITHNMLVNGVTNSYQTFTFPIGSIDASNSPLQANAIVTDSSPITSSNVLDFVVNPAISTPTISASSAPTINANQMEMLTSTVSGGTSPYTYVFHVYNSATNTLIRTLSTSAGTTGSVSFSVAILKGYTFYANVLVTDSASTAVSANSVPTQQITVNGTKQEPSTVPPNIIYYLPIMLINNQSAGLAANTPLAIGVSASYSSLAGNVTGITATQYQQYELPELNNTEFFFGNGTIINSWLEGNLLGEDTANSIATSVTSQNALSTSANVLFWINYNWPSSFLTSNTGTSPTNIIYMGFAGNVISPANVLFSNTIDGEAPQLTCANPYNTAACAGSYGYYDDGANVFNFYSNFTAQGSNWQQIPYSGSIMTVDNGILLNPNGGQAIYATTGMFTPNVVEAYFPEVVQGTVLFFETTLPTDTGGDNGYHDGFRFDYGRIGGVAQYRIVSNVGGSGATRAETPPPVQPAPPGVWEGVWPSQADEQFFVNYTLYPTSTFSGVTYNSAYIGVGGGGSSDSFAQWFRAMNYPPNGVLPSTVFGIVKAASSTATVTVSNSVVVQGQYQSVTAGVLSMTGPYTYNFFVSNSVTRSIITQTATYPGVSSASQVFTFQTNALDYANSPLAINVVVSNSTGQVASANILFTVNAMLSVPSISASNTPTVNVLQYEVFTGTVSNGQPPYTFNFLVYNTENNKQVANELLVNSYSITNTFAWQPTATVVGNTIYANVIVTDSAEELTNSIQTSPIQILSSLTTPTLSASNTPSVNALQYEVFSAYVSGISPLTYNFLVYNSITNALIANDLTSSNTFTWQVPLVAVGNAIYANVIVTDTGGEAANSVLTSSILILPASAFEPTGVPANILFYLPITLTNTQSSAVAPNTPLAIGTTITGNILGMNAVLYQQYEACNMQNAEFFLQNGTVINSWLEGNYINELTANLLCSSANSQNALSGSANVLFWVEYNWPSTFLPANAGTATTNTIYLGWVGNVVTTSNDLFNGKTIGEAAQLSCSEPYAFAACNGIYGQYDNGNTVFSFYDDFKGSSINSNVWDIGSTSWPTTNLQIIAQNALSFAGGTPGYQSNVIYMNDGSITTPQYFEGLMDSYTTDGSAFVTIGVSGDLIDPSSYYYAGFCAGGTEGSYAYVQQAASGASSGIMSGCSPFSYVTSGISSRPPQVQGIYWESTGSELAVIGMNAIAASDSAIDQSFPLYGFVAEDNFNQGGAIANFNYSWVRFRLPPPNNIMPYSTFGNVVSAVPILNISSTSTVYGQQSVISVTPFSPFDVSNIIIDGTQVASGLSQRSYTICSPPTPSSCLGVGIHAVLACDSTTGMCVSNTISVSKTTPNETLTVYPSNSVPYPGSVAFTATPYDIGNQLGWNLYNQTNTILATASNTMMYSGIQPGQLQQGNYTFTYNTVGDGNYFSASVTNTVLITPPVPCDNGCYTGSGGTGASGTTIPITSAATTTATTTVAPTTASTTINTTTTILVITVIPTPPAIANSSTVVIQVNATNSTPAVINFTDVNARFRIFAGSMSESRINVTFENLTRFVETPAGLYTISAVNISSDQKVSGIEAEMHYPCNVPANSLAPYTDVNGTWEKLQNYTVDSSTCTMTIRTSNTGILAIFSNSTAAAPQNPYLLAGAVAAVAAIVIGSLLWYIHALRAAAHIRRK